ncbi:MAG: hypothetical protein LBS69_05365 [Prevotellaceae bacterium]|jgi:hypothetical protein|nr:hypothetical protein [Prevotellaceae bacterium]
MNKIIKIFAMVFMPFLLSLPLYAQKDVTQFLGIPVDGYKHEMIQKLKAKGFTVSPSNKDVLVGEFNGTKVNIHVVTNNNKVYRIMVSDAISQGETDIKIRFNKLCQQFQNNEKYMPASLSESDYTIPEDEDISYEMSVKNKRYEAVFCQVPNIDTAVIMKEFGSFLLTKYTEEQLSNFTEEEVQKESIPYILDKIDKKSVWFMISELYGKYYITMFYDNEYNRANGEDL